MIELTEKEQERLDRILSCENLEKERKIAIPFLILAGCIIIFLPIIFIFSFDPGLAVVIAPLSIVSFLVGMTKLGYYKLFRLIHYQAAQIKKENEK